MKKQQLSFIFLIFITSSILYLFLFGKEIEKQEEIVQQAVTSTPSIEVPSEITFAGEKFFLDRYDLRERFDREINAFTYYHSTTLLLFKRANRIFPIIEPILKAEGLHDDFKYLAVIESSLNPRAVSPARAAGLWQFIAETGRRFGLQIDKQVDERFSIEKSTVAATRYLKDAFSKYNSWTSAILSYNGGMGRITRELSNQDADCGLDLWLTEETSRYFFRMAALKLIFENPRAYGFVIEPHHLYKPIEFDRVTVSSSIESLNDFAEKYNISYAQLKDFNSWLISRELILSDKNKKDYTILVPKKKSLFYKRGETVKVHDERWIGKTMKK